jgi:hypothetical protein
MMLKRQSEEAGDPRPRRRFFLIAALVAFALACPVLVARLVPAAEPPAAVSTALTTTAPTPTPPGKGTSALQHYENKWLAFDYPANFKVHEPDDESAAWNPPVDFGGETLAFLGDPAFFEDGTCYRHIRISRLSACTCVDLAEVMDDQYGALDPRWILEESPMQPPALFNIGGMRTAQKIYRVYWGEPAYDMRDVWVRRGTDVYIVSIYTRWTEPDDLALFQSTADRILASLVIK